MSLTELGRPLDYPETLSGHSQNIPKEHAMSEAAVLSSADPLTREPSPAPRTFINRVVNADCLTVLPELPSRCIDFVLTDPPYLSRYLDRTGRTVTNDDRDPWLIPAFAEIYRVLKPNRFCVSFYGWSKVDSFFAAWRGAGFRPVGHLVWPKRYASAERFLGYCHEQAYLLAKGNPPQPTEKLRDVLAWYYTGNRLHPTQKPVPSLKPVIEVFTRRGDIVLDPFCGSGSTLLAAKILGCRYIGIEMDAGHAKTAERRLA
jgi:adenine-specific DNA-methyltransferase